METDPAATLAPNRRIALLIDADNVSHSRIATILAELSKHGSATIRRAYGDWTNNGLKGWQGKLHDFAIRPIQQFSYSTGKNATDIALVIDAMELLYTQKLDGFCIASSDGDFTPLVMQLRANGHEVYGFGERKTPKPFVNACTTFLYLDGADGIDVPAAEAKPARRVAARPKLVAAAPAKPDTAALAGDETLLVILRGAVEAAERDDGWAVLSTAGSAAKRQASIDPRNYGCKNFPALFEAVGLFDIVKGDDGMSFVADKRNRDRTPRPTR